MEKELTFNQHVKLTIDSGLAPIELKYYPIVNVDGPESIAFRTSTSINSIVFGELKEDDYKHISDKRLCGIELLKHNIQHAIGAIKAFTKANKQVGFISVRCPGEIIERTSLYDLVKEVLQQNPSVDPSKLCLEFPENLLELDPEKVKYAVLDMKLLKVRTALQGVGKEEFKVSKLTSIPVDFAIIDKSASEWAGSRNKPQLFNSLLSYISAMGVESIAIGTQDNKKEIRYSDAVGFYLEGTEPITLEAAVEMAEEADV